jgi:putative molybdopterin biosynthesis protein
MSGSPYVCKLAELRRAANLSQAELARRAGISRQMVSMIEHDHVTPSVAVALALARTLSCTVEDLYQSRDTAGPIEVILSAETPARSGPVGLAEIGDRWIAIAPSERISFGACDGRLISTNGHMGFAAPLLPIGQLRQNLVIAGCDPAIGVVRDIWKSGDDGGRVRWRDLPSQAALNALARGEVHVAGVHFPNAEVERLALAALGMPVQVVRFARWEQGWMLHRGNPSGFRSVEDLASARLINRVPGAGSRLLLDELLAEAGIGASDVPDYSHQVRTHFDCAGAIREGRADVAMGLRAVAEMCDLDFLPVREVAFDLVIPNQFCALPPVAKLLDLLQTGRLRDQLAALPGYTTTETGKVMNAAAMRRK